MLKYQWKTKSNKTGIKTIKGIPRDGKSKKLGIKIFLYYLFINNLLINNLQLLINKKLKQNNIKDKI